MTTWTKQIGSGKVSYNGTYKLVDEADCKRLVVEDSGYIVATFTGPNRKDREAQALAWCAADSRRYVDALNSEYRGWTYAQWVSGDFNAVEFAPDLSAAHDVHSNCV